MEMAESIDRRAEGERRGEPQHLAVIGDQPLAHREPVYDERRIAYHELLRAWAHYEHVLNEIAEGDLPAGDVRDVAAAQRHH